ncbi:MAG TPA: hypothetical protein VGD78_06150 [Chthoniobacterales bacterium]
MMLDEPQLQQLLKLKRFEQPPPGYFDDALQEFHRRQRADLLRQSALKIWWERSTSSLGQFRIPAYAYGGVFGVFCVLAALVGSGALNPGTESGLATLEAQVKTGSAGRLTLNRQFEWGEVERASLSLAPSIAPSKASLPRYVLEGRPVSTEVSLSF